MKPLQLEQKFPIVIGDTGVSGNTCELVSIVRELLKKEPEKNEILDKIDDITNNALKAIENEDLEYLGQLMNENHKLLKELNVSHPLLEKMIKASLDAGALGAKLSGAGGGGIMIALAENEEQQKKITKTIESVGGKSIITDMGVDGVRVVE